LGKSNSSKQAKKSVQKNGFHICRIENGSIRVQ
jgi:regulator of replication initiation timing